MLHLHVPFSIHNISQFKPCNEHWDSICHFLVDVHGGVGPVPAGIRREQRVDQPTLPQYRHHVWGPQGVQGSLQLVHQMAGRLWAGQYKAMMWSGSKPCTLLTFSLTRYQNSTDVLHLYMPMGVRGVTLTVPSLVTPLTYMYYTSTCLW